MANHTKEQGIEAMQNLIDKGLYKEADFYYSDSDYLELDIEVGTPLLSDGIDDFITAYDHWQGWLQMQEPNNDDDFINWHIENGLL